MNIKIMEAKDVMVGDLVIKHTETRGDIVVTVTPSIINCIDFAETFAPIPWTAESAKKNCFEKYAEKTYRYFKVDDKSYYTGFESVWYYEETSSFNIVKEEVDGFQNTIKIKKQYYHELQHALRLVGLNEVADNLKV